MKRVGLLLALFVYACGSGIFDDPNRGPGNAAPCRENCTSPVVEAGADADGPTVERSACVGQPAGWINELADAAGDTGRYPSLGVDAAGTVHVSYFDTNGTIRVARRIATGVWSHESIDTVGTVPNAGDEGMGTSLVLDDAGAAVIAYYDLANRDLKVARGGSSWTLETADAGGDVGGWPSLVVDGAGTHVTYYDRTARRLKAAHRDLQGGWKQETVETVPSGWQSSLAKDASGGLHAFYSEEQQYLRYAYKPRDGQWNPGRVQGNSHGLWSSLAVDSLGGLHVTHCSKYGSGELLYSARPGPTTWTTSPIESATGMAIGWSSVLGLDAQGAVHAVYIHQSKGELRYARQVSASWEIATLDSPGTPLDLGRYIALSIDRHGALHVAYYDARAGDLRYARRCP